MKKAGVKDFWVYTDQFGRTGRLVSTVRTIAKYAESQSAARRRTPRSRGPEEAAQRLNARRATLFSSTETNVYRYVPCVRLRYAAADASELRTRFKRFKRFKKFKFLY